MACNAHNHDNARCNCGFTGGYDGGWETEPDEPWPTHLGSGIEHWASQGCSLTSFTVPNVRCKYCGALVFFYRSPYDGRVFFDQLGPPWPKHECFHASDQRPIPRRLKPGWVPVLKVEPLPSFKTVKGYDAKSRARILIPDGLSFEIEWLMLSRFNWDGPVAMKDEGDGSLALGAIEVREARRLGGKPYVKRLRLRAQTAP